MYMVSTDVVKPSKPDSKRIVMETIKEYVDETKAGDPRFYLRALSRYLQGQGYDINSWAIYQIINGAVVDDSHVFEKVVKGKAVYKCNPVLFNQYLDREFPNVFTAR
jgi:hypothetical protein